MRYADESAVLEAIDLLEKGDWGEALTLLAALKAQLLSGAAQDARVNTALSILSQDYYDTIKRIVDEFVREWRAGEFQGSRDSANESLEQACDNACTYTQTAQIYLAMSQEDGAYLEEFGEVPHDGASVRWSAMAAVALLADVRRAIKHAGIDTNDDPPENAQVDCTVCLEWSEGQAVPGEDDVCDACREATEESGSDED